MLGWRGETNTSRSRRSRIVASLVLILVPAVVVAEQIGDYDENYARVRGIASMRMPPPGTPPLLRLIGHPFAWIVACDALVLLGCVAVVLIASGILAMWKARDAPLADFERSRRRVRLGALATLVLLGLGYAMVGGELFGVDWDGRVDLTFLGAFASVLIYAILPEE